MIILGVVEVIIGFYLGLGVVRVREGWVVGLLNSICCWCGGGLGGS
jgi:hypothetical protein